MGEYETFCEMSGNPVTVYLHANFCPIIRSYGEHPLLACPLPILSWDEHRKELERLTAPSRQRLLELEEAEKLLGLLEAGGVDNWEGWSDAISAMGEDE